MGDQTKPGDNSTPGALHDANRLVDRLQDEVGAYLDPAASPEQQEEAVGQMIGDLEASPEVRTVREADGQDPGKFGSASNPGGKEPRRIYDEFDEDLDPAGRAEGPDQIALEAEIASLEDDFGKLETPEAMERTADEISAGLGAYDGGPIVGRAVAAELRRRALKLRNQAPPRQTGTADFSKEAHDRVTGPAIERPVD